MVEGVLIAESLKVGTSLDDLQLTVRKLSRWEIADAADHQPTVWTILDFDSDQDPDKLAERLANVLDAPSWYVDFSTEEIKYVVFPGKVLRYRRGDGDGRAEAVAYARTVGVPDTQLDWSD